MTAKSQRGDEPQGGWGGGWEAGLSSQPLRCQPFNWWASVSFPSWNFACPLSPELPGALGRASCLLSYLGPRGAGWSCSRVDCNLGISVPEPVLQDTSGAGWAESTWDAPAQRPQVAGRLAPELSRWHGSDALMGCEGLNHCRRP